ncbi:MAG: response regulator transcription factor [Firmicutes bacterium]|jgi:two-component system OmpR family response regulator|nr:response regulator transcription factor [Bacillota bacterium]MCL5065119.1 response regulator transcription factor [Bacillota bacterium]
MNESEARILVVDDEESIRDLLVMGLGHRGFEVEAYATAEDALAEVGRLAPHAAIVDIMLPGEDGFQLTRKLRQDPELYILVLTARDATQDLVQGLDGGADDYVVKPFELDELVARLKAGLRRVQRDIDTKMRFREIFLDDSAHRVEISGQLVNLTAKEYELLRYLMRNPGQVVSKSQILTHVWGYEYPGDDNLVEVHISSLRDKIGDTEKQTVQTVRGFGYRLGG